MSNKKANNVSLENAEKLMNEKYTTTIRVTTKNDKMKFEKEISLDEYKDLLKRYPKTLQLCIPASMTFDVNKMNKSHILVIRLPRGWEKMTNTVGGYKVRYGARGGRYIMKGGVKRYI